MNSTSKPGTRISSSILMTSSSWQTAKHRIGAVTVNYTLARGWCPSDAEGVQCHSATPVRAPKRSPKSWIVVPATALAIGVWSHVAAQQIPLFRAGIDLVSLGVTVTDRAGNLVGGLTSDDFEVVEDGVKQT